MLNTTKWGISLSSYQYYKNIYPVFLVNTQTEKGTFWLDVIIPHSNTIETYISLTILLR